MMKQKISTKEKIVLATIDCIERDGIQNITIRRIAHEAGVNSAAINYHYGSKEKLINIALNRTMEEMTKMPSETLDLKNKSPKELLQNFLETFMGGAIQWPGIAKAHIYNPLIKNDYSNLFVKRFNSFLEDLIFRMKGLKTNWKEEELRFSLIQLISAVTLPALMPKLFAGFSDIHFEKKEDRRAYIGKLLDHYMGK